MTITPAEHLDLAETLIEELDEKRSAIVDAGGPPWHREHAMRLAELHIAAANAHANIRQVFTLQTIAALIAGDDTPTDTPGGNPWESPSNVRTLPSRTKTTE